MMWRNRYRYLLGGDLSEKNIEEGVKMSLVYIVYSKTDTLYDVFYHRATLSTFNPGAPSQVASSPFGRL